MKASVLAIVVLALAAAGIIVFLHRSSRADRAAGPIDNQPPGERVPVLVELFTSEGCASCPPADEVLGRLARAQPVSGAEVIVLSEHVDYWNDLGWADPFSSPRFSERQEQYRTVFHRDDIYTPQMVVDGREEFRGSDAGHANQAIQDAAAPPKAPVRLALTPGAAGEVRLTAEIQDAGEQRGHEPADVLLAVTEDELRSDVRRGENSGHNLSHTGVVRRLETLGSMEAQAPRFSTTKSIRLDGRWRRENLKAVVFAQERSSRHVVAAGAISLAH